MPLSLQAMRTTALLCCALFVAACSSTAPTRQTATKPAHAPIERHKPSPAARALQDKSRTATPVKPEEDRTSNDLWSELPSLFMFDASSRAEVAKEIEWLANNPKYVERVSLNAAPFLHFVVQEIRARKLPGELALLPILESGYDATARSPYGAAGLWQFMGGTGDTMGLAVTPWFDGRVDVEKSTRAALDYLATLQQQLGGDWLLALSAYNLGWGTVERSLASQRRKGKSLDFWSLDGLRPSRPLVARLLALAAVLRDRERYGIRFLPIPNRPFFARVELSKPTDLAALAGQLEVDSDLFRRLNPGWRRGHTGPTREATVLVPMEHLDASRRIVATLPASPIPALPPPGRPKGKASSVASGKNPADARELHRVQDGDSLWTIAAAHDTSVENLLKANPGITRKTVLALGQSLRLPAATPRTAARATAARDAAKSRHYQVKAGDSLWTIARQFKVSVEDLLAWNGLKRDAQLKLGQDLVVSPAS